MPAALDIAGRRFGRLVALAPTKDRYESSVVWDCQCDCGARVQKNARKLNAGNVRSCGCLSRDTVRALNRGRRTHGRSGTPEFAVWINMIARCTNEKDASYPRYGGRGIQVCGRWLNSFEAFLEDMGERPFPGAQIDREDNDGDYEPGNCAWVTRRANMNNRRNSRFIEFRGRRQTIAEWSREIGCSRQALRSRLENGWSVEEALTIPVSYANSRRSK